MDRCCALAAAAAVFVVCASAASCNTSDEPIAAHQGNVYRAQEDALRELYDATNGNHWKNSSNWCSSGAGYCNWFGVGCGGAGHVTSLRLGNNSLVGTVPAGLVSLTALSKLSLSRNSLYGTVPLLTSLTHLSYLGLGDNSLSGTALSQLESFTALKQVFIVNNRFSGTMPPKFNSVDCTVLALDVNAISGTLSPELASMTALLMLYIYNNSLSGTLMQNLDTFEKLNAIVFSQNRISGHLVPVPPSLMNYIGSRNLISGYIGASAQPVPGRNLAEVDATFNRLSGTYSPQIVNWYSAKYDLVQIFCSNNWGISGTVPPNYFNGPLRIGFLTVGGCLVSGTIPEVVGQHPLFNLGLGNSSISGTLPPSLYTLTGLIQTYLEDMPRLSGTMSGKISLLTAMEQLVLGGGGLSGTLPSTLSLLTALQFLGVFDNELSGQLPSDVHRLTSMTIVAIAANELSGSLPSNFGHMSCLQFVTIQKNQVLPTCQQDYD